MEAGKRDQTYLMLSSSFLPGHQAPTPIKLPPLGLTVGPMIRKNAQKGEVVPTASIVVGALGQYAHQTEYWTYIWSIGGMSTVETPSEGYTYSKHTGLSFQTSRRSLRIRSRTLLRKHPQDAIIVLPYMGFYYC